MFLRQRTQWNNRKDRKKGPRVSLEQQQRSIFVSPGNGKHTARHHSCKMSSGASSKAERLPLIHKQLPLSLCCRFRTAVPPNISFLLPGKYRKKKKQKKREHVCLPSEKNTPCRVLANQNRTLKDEGGEEQRTKRMQYLVFYVNEIAGWHTNVSVNGSMAFLPLQGNPLGWLGPIQWGARWMTHSGEACRIVEETIQDAGVHFFPLNRPLKTLRTSQDVSWAWFNKPMFFWQN